MDVSAPAESWTKYINVYMPSSIDKVHVHSYDEYINMKICMYIFLYAHPLYAHFKVLVTIHHRY